MSETSNDLGQKLSEALREIEEDLPPEYLQMIAYATDGFNLKIDPHLPKDKIGYTDMEKRTIYINPNYLLTLSREARKGFMLHETGHHVPPVKKNYDMMCQLLTDPNFVPEKYRTSEQTIRKFLETIHSSVINVTSDIWDEAYMSRYPYAPFEQAIKTMYQFIPENGRNYHGFSLPEQYIQIFAGEARYRPTAPIDQLIDPAVYESYQRVLASGALETLQDESDFISSFSDESALEQNLKRKIIAFNVFLKEYLKLFDLEVEKRKKQQQENKQEDDQKQKKGNKQEQGQSQEEMLTKSVTEQLLDELAEQGKKRKSLTPSKEDLEADEGRKRKFEEIGKQIVNQPKESPKPPDLSAYDEFRNDFKRGIREADQQRQKGLAEQLQTNPEVIRKWEKIKNKYRIEIEGAASVLGEVFLEDRRKKIEYLLREGDTIDGLQAEEDDAYANGEIQPKTKYQYLANPQFLQTDLEFVIDTSGSMSGEKIAASIEMLVILIEAFKIIKKNLEEEYLLQFESEEPLQIGATKFSTTAEVISPSKEPVSDKKQIKIIDKLSQTEGGTDETDALIEVIKHLHPLPGNIIKIVIVLSDGQGNKESVASIMQHVEQENKVIFLIAALGDTSSEVVDAYTSSLSRKGANSNIHAEEAKTPKEILPKVLAFIKREVQKRKYE